jgi:hypothetical protein
MVSKHVCVRVQKQASALRALGWRVDSLSLQRPRNLSLFDLSVVASEETMAKHLRENAAPIIHVHNEPDKLMRFASDGANGRPIVYDCHDLEGNSYGGVPTEDELFAFSRADGIINVSHAHRDVAYSQHPWTCPEAVVRSFPMRKWKPGCNGERSGVVYQGGLQPPGKCSWRDLSVPCREFAEAGIQFDLFVPKWLEEHYPNVQGFLAYEELLKRLTGYSFGFCGHDPAHPVYETAMPNKVWEYAMCGVIPLFVNLKHASEVFGSGIVATSTQDAIAQMRECDEEALRAEVLAHARYMDDEIHNTVRLYEELL